MGVVNHIQSKKIKTISGDYQFQQHHYYIKKYVNFATILRKLYCIKDLILGKWPVNCFEFPYGVIFTQ